MTYSFGHYLLKTEAECQGHSYVMSETNDSVGGDGQGEGRQGYITLSAGSELL